MTPALAILHLSTEFCQNLLVTFEIFCKQPRTDRHRIKQIRDLLEECKSHMMSNCTKYYAMSILCYVHVFENFMMLRVCVCVCPLH